MLTLFAGLYKTGGPGVTGRGLVGDAGVGTVMAFITWLGFVAVLFALARFLWKKGDKVK